MPKPLVSPLRSPHAGNSPLLGRTQHVSCRQIDLMVRTHGCGIVSRNVDAEAALEIQLGEPRLPYLATPLPSHAKLSFVL